MTEYEQKYTEQVEAHIGFVREAGKQIGVDPRQLAVHDQSKWSAAEFAPYARWFGANDKSAESKQAFSYAWLHHIHHNPHHWQHWLLQLDSGKMMALEMPQNYALEMVADWMGASMAYTGSWDMTEWLTKSISNIQLHKNTARYVSELLASIGYADIVETRQFKV